VKLLRLYEPSDGRVTVHGVDIRGLTFGDLRGAIGLVSQDVFLFDGTVRENIAYGDPGASPEAIEEAAKLAEAHEFISALSHGYATLVGERGRSPPEASGSLCPSPGRFFGSPIFVIDDETSSGADETGTTIQRLLRTSPSGG
jgi:ATP-binding cassette subfamily B protein